MAEFKVVFSDEAKLDLFYYPASERKIVTSGIRSQLLYQPSVGHKEHNVLLVRGQEVRL